MRIDAHLHVWDLPRGPVDGRPAYPWLTPEHGELYASFTPEQAKGELDAAGFDAAVLVQADDTMAETDHLLTVAAEHPWVAGVVGWIPLDDPPAAAGALDRLAENRRLVGVRHLVHNDPRDDFLALPAVRESLAMLAGRDLTFDVPDAWPRHLDAAADLAAALPDLTIVIDHLGKPPRGSEDFGAWHRSISRAAALPNVAAKVSGLRMPGTPFDVGALDDTWSAALEAFGPRRLMYGGDWPMVVPDGGYAPTWHVMSELIHRLPASDAALLLGGTAARIYRLDTAKYCRREPGRLQ
ncbi:amidohydrolase family protein [Spelaeicoccus albus]